MAGSTISSTVILGVTIGSGAYTSPLTITSTGTIAPTSGSSALYSDYKGVYNPQTSSYPGGIASNEGVITGVSNATQYGYGGAGADFIGGTLTNAGSIVGGSGFFGGGGVQLKSVTFVNSGVVSAGQGQNGDGVFLYGGSVLNGGTIVGDAGGAGISVFGGSVTNNGTILDSGGGTGVAFSDGGTLFNNGTIGGGFGGKYGVEQLFAGHVYNYGTIGAGSGGSNANGGVGDLLNGGGYSGDVTLKNAAGATVAGGFGTQLGGTGVVAAQLGSIDNLGVVLGGDGGATGGDGADVVVYGIITNYGTVRGGDGTGTGGDGVYVGGGTFSNAGTVFGGAGPTGGVGVAIAGGGMLTTSGLITGGNNGAADAVCAYNGALRLVVDPGAAFQGAVAASTWFANVLELASGSSAGTLDIGGSFSGFSGITFDSDATWALSGAVGGLAAGQTVAGFVPQDTIFVDGFVASSNSYVADDGLEISNGSTIETLNITGSFGPSSFLVTADGNKTEIELLCYLRGTRILTPAGEVAVEDLGLGDAVVTRFGGYQKIKWVGRQSYGSRFIRNNRDQIPVRIAAGALADGLPKRDLFVSPGHSMLLGGTLVLARDLVNGVTIKQDELSDEVHYYQLELDGHDCVLAEGSWSESFCDYGGLRNQFHNVAEFLRLYPDHVTPVEHRMCAPRPETGPELEAALRAVAKRTAALVTPGRLRGWVDEIAPGGLIRGWAEDTANPHLPVLLEIMDGKERLGTTLACHRRADLAAAGIGLGRCAFVFNGPEISTRAPGAIRVFRAADAAELPVAPHCLTGSAPRRRRA